MGNMPIKQKIHDWERIKEDFIKSNYEQLTPYLREIEGFTDVQITSGQTRRKLGNFQILEKSKSLQKIGKPTKNFLKNPEKFIKQVEVSNARDLVQMSMNSKNSIYASLVMAVEGVKSQLADGILPPLEVLKTASSLEKVIEMFDKIEANIRDKYNIKDVIDIADSEIKSQGTLLSEVSGRGVSGEGSGERGGSDNHKQMVFVTVQPDKPKN
jgi:hypothetical protein